MELTVLIPCLNEADTVGVCVRQARETLGRLGIDGEVLVADNGSTDGSPDIALAAGARVVPVRVRGYGSALMGGIEAARGEFIVIGDADDSYDFGELGALVEKLRQGFELVQGCRLPRGGGTILPGAMPGPHRWWGNPMFTWLAQWWFGSPVHDIYCGLRAFRKELIKGLDLRCTGMEFAAEMVIKASLSGARITEAPVTLRPDGRKSHRSHLNTFRDGWRTLRIFLLYTPRWLFLVPGVGLILLGLLGYALALPGVTVWGATLDAHTLLFASLALLTGYQSMLFAAMTMTFTVQAGLLPRDERWERLFGVATLERGLAVGGVALVAGLLLLLIAVNQWRLADFGPLNYARTMRVVIPGATLSTLGVQTILSSFFLSLLRLHRR